MKTRIVTSLKREAVKILAELNKTKEPVLITERGRPSAYLVDADDFEMLMQRLRLLEGIAKGEMALMEGRVMSHDTARRKMKKWLT